jgi:flagellar hook protein FlgE
MFTAFSTALSGLDAQATAIDVVGNNLANLNTPGFKASTCAFQDMISQALGGSYSDTQVGFGVGRPVTIREFSQGAIQTTSGNLDAAINGDGFFIVRDSGGSQLYTRAGNLQVDKDGNLITATGDKVQGWTGLNGTVDTTGPVGNLVLPVGALHGPAATKNVSVDLNLNASAQAGSADGTFSTTMDVYDSLGVSHSLTFTFTKSSTANQWDYSVSVPDSDLQNAFTPVKGTLTFNPDGTLATPAQTDPPIDIPIPGLADGAADMDLKWSLYDGLTGRLTQYSQESSPSAINQDGNPAANLIKVSIGNGGQIVAQYSNKQQVVVGQIGMALVRNPESLIAVGNNNYALSGQSAAPAIGLPNTGGRGDIVGSAVEASTADIAREFTNLIVYQRAYEANAKVVTTTDQMSQDTINLKQ